MIRRRARARLKNRFIRPVLGLIAVPIMALIRVLIDPLKRPF
ncbi:hypothetical protein EDD55_105109 [Varunaivibrio sulfuroxidans]|uniref:Uncharacterized protein n=1 Tax=Varunaivibrio sulfuroxidans TaxID=1773489 RepID=A0A4R3JBW5_9PROT|nr:hypothetical protein EDD55_105109 [Varunaivibrio sulfuroxidans]